MRDVNPKAEPPQTDFVQYDRTLEEVHDYQVLTGCAGWTRFFGSLLAGADEATHRLESAEKMRDVIRCQATLTLVKEQKAKLRQPVEDLNSLRGRYPLFAQDFPWRAEFDEPTGRVTLIRLSPAGGRAGQDALEADAVRDVAAEAAAAADARAAGEVPTETPPTPARGTTARRRGAPTQVPLVVPGTKPGRQPGARGSGKRLRTS